MKGNDRYWLLGGLVLGLAIAANNAMHGQFDGSSFALGRLVGNVLGGMLVCFVVGRIVARLSNKG